jgi:hypothetical protein
MFPAVICLPVLAKSTECINKSAATFTMLDAQGNLRWYEHCSE